MISFLKSLLPRAWQQELERTRHAEAWASDVNFRDAQALSKLTHQQIAVLEQERDGLKQENILLRTLLEKERKKVKSTGDSDVASHNEWPIKKKKHKGK